MKSWVNGIFAVTLFQEDLEKAKKFYLDVFGLPMEFEDKNSCVFKVGGTMVNLLRTSATPELINPAKMATPESGSRLVFTIMVEDVDEVCERLISLGVKLLNGPMDRPWGIRTASFMDPGGHIWEIAK